MYLFSSVKIGTHSAINVLSKEGKKAENTTLVYSIYRNICCYLVSEVMDHHPSCKLDHLGKVY